MARLTPYALGAIVAVVLGFLLFQRGKESERLRAKVADAEARFTTAVSAYATYQSLLAEAKKREDSLLTRADTVIRYLTRTAPTIDAWLKERQLDTIPEVRSLVFDRNRAIAAAVELRGAYDSCALTRDSALVLSDSLRGACTRAVTTLAPLAKPRRLGLGAFAGPGATNEGWEWWVVGVGATYRFW